MTKNMIKSIREVASFAGYHLTELKVLQLDDLLYIDNFRKAMVNSKEGDKEGQESTKKFIRKGQKISKDLLTHTIRKCSKMDGQKYIPFFAFK